MDQGVWYLASGGFVAVAMFSIRDQPILGMALFVAAAVCFVASGAGRGS